MIPPRTIIRSRYEVDGYLASGGMQDVYRAKDHLTGTLVALKTPQAGQHLKRFKDSAHLAARINHHNVAKTLDYLEFENECYLVEELVDGGTLEDVTLAIIPQIDPGLAAHILSRLAKGLAASHTAQVAHRDLKPSNVLVSGTNLEELKISDFGIATLAENLIDGVARSGDLTRSTSGTIRGALPYMAPEMMFRSPGDIVGAEADIWSLGAVMFRLLTGEYPFGEGMYVPVNVQNGTRKAWPTFMTRLSQFSFLNKTLIEIVERCLIVDKAKRPTARELVTKCDDICFLSSRRLRGIVKSMEGNKCFLRGVDGTKVFFHRSSVYGALPVQIGSSVVYSSYPGAPWSRAHPVVVAATAGP